MVSSVRLLEFHFANLTPVVNFAYVISTVRPVRSPSGRVTLAKSSCTNSITPCGALNCTQFKLHRIHCTSAQHLTLHTGYIALHIG